MIGFYNRDEKFLLRGMNWVFKQSSLPFVFIRLKRKNSKSRCRQNTRIRLKMYVRKQCKLGLTWSAISTYRNLFKINYGTSHHVKKRQRGPYSSSLRASRFEIRIPVGTSDFMFSKWAQRVNGDHSASSKIGYRGSFQRINWLWRGVGHPPSSSADVENGYNNTSTYRLGIHCNVMG